MCVIYCVFFIAAMLRAKSCEALVESRCRIAALKMQLPLLHNKASSMSHQHNVLTSEPSEHSTNEPPSVSPTSTAGRSERMTTSIICAFLCFDHFTFTADTSQHLAAPYNPCEFNSRRSASPRLVNGTLATTNRLKQDTVSCSGGGVDQQVVAVDSGCSGSNCWIPYDELMEQIGMLKERLGALEQENSSMAVEVFF